MPVGRQGLTCAVVREIPNDGNGSIFNRPRIPLIMPPQSSRRPPRPALRAKGRPIAWSPRSGAPTSVRRPTRGASWY